MNALTLRCQRLFLLAVLLFSTQLSAESLESLIENFEPTAEEISAGASILRHRVEIEIQGDDNITKRVYLAIAVLDQQASSDYSKIRESFNSFYDEMTLNRARLIDARGEAQLLEKDAVQLKTSNKENAYDDLRTLAFTLPAITPGSFLEYEFELRSKRPVIPGYWYGHDWLNVFHALTGRIRIDPLRHASLSLDLPAEQHLNIETSGNLALLHDRTQDQRRQLLWEARNLPEIVLEEGMPDFFAPMTKLETSSIPDWRTVNRWADAIFNQAAEADEKIRKLVANLVGPDMDDLQKVKTIFYWVQQNIRYIGADLKRGGVVPHKASKVLSNRFGDCKDQAVLLIAMLREAGVTADPVLISPGSVRQVSTKVPSLRFNHMIVKADLNGKAIWLDTSADAGSFPGIDPSLEGQNGFVINSEGGGFSRLPESGIDDNELRMDLDFGFAGDDLRVHVKVRTKGAHDHRLKTLLKNSPEFRDALQESLGKVYDSSNRFEGFEITFDEHDGGHLNISGELVFENRWRSGQRENFLCNGDLKSILVLFSHLLTIPDKPRRFDFQSGLPARYRLVTRCPSPGDDYRPNRITGDLNIDHAHFHYSRTIEQGLDGVIVEQDFILKGNVIPAAEYLAFRRDIREAASQSSWFIRYGKDESYIAKLTLKRKLESNGQDHQARIELARQHMAEAEYGLAREMIRQVLADMPGHGEAHYVHGLVLGFLDEFDASDVAFRKAEELGYRP